jgi:hypothetical protein
MNIRIVPFTVDPIHDLIRDTERQIKKYDLPITYWGIYLYDKRLSYTLSKEIAEKAKLWVEKWLSDRSQ